MNARYLLGTSLLLALTTQVACGDDATNNTSAAGGQGSTTAGSNTASTSSTNGAGGATTTAGGGGESSTTTATTGAGGGGGGDCSNPGGGANSCNDPACFINQACIDQDLATAGKSDFVPCGQSVTFAVSDSDTVCQDYGSGAFQELPTRCQFATYAGTITFYCPSSGPIDEVGVRYVAHSTIPLSNGLWETVGAEYSYANGSGSTNGPVHRDSTINGNTREEDFVGYEWIGVANGVLPLTVWLGVMNFGTSVEPEVSGGFSVPIDVSKL